MKRSVWARAAVAAFAILVIPLGAQAQSAAETIERALGGAPERVRAEATVVKFNADHTWETLKEGSNPWVCYDRSGEGRRPAYAVQCTNIGNLARIAQNRRFGAEAADREALQAMVAAAEAAGTRETAVYGSMWLAVNGPDMASARTHTTIAVPGGTSESTGFPTCGDGGGACIMAGGSGAAHLMVPTSR
ncbi:MAG: hypothetical protein OEU54_17675 [Gemmatimonadota bacterium]|nr:hypothetical protein [Gemmatimonadota bacterium]